MRARKMPSLFPFTLLPRLATSKQTLEGSVGLGSQVEKVIFNEPEADRDSPPLKR
jgi:hypothetical protein